MESLSEDELKNIYIIKREFIRELDKGLGRIKKSISRVFSGIFLNIPANLFYYVYFRGKVRKFILNQIKISLRMAAEYDPVRDNLDELVDKYRDDYLSNDLITIHSKYDHPVFNELQEITINNLYSRIPILHSLIHSRGETYKDLVKNTFTTRDEVRKVLEIQLIFMDQWIEILRENQEILKGPKVFGVELPMPASALFSVIFETYEYGIERLEKKLDEFFNGDDKDTTLLD
ncbi:MAG: hypothetical protein ACTSXP_07785 [Promethearchaeota archaeon]